MQVVTHPAFEDFVRGEGLDFASAEGDPSALVASHFDLAREASTPPSWLPKGIIDMREAMRAGRGMFAALTQGMPEMTDQCWKSTQDADVLLLSTLGTLMGIPIAQKRRIPAFAAYVQPLLPTAELPPLFMFPPAPSC